MHSVSDNIAGRIRNTRVIVGAYKEKGGIQKLHIKHEPPFHNKSQIERSLTELFDWTEQLKDIPPVLKAGIFHHQYVYIHPFVDGNGRTCRLLTALIFLKHNYQINKYFVLDDYYDIDRIQYSDKLHSADSGDKTEWLSYFSDGVKYSLQSAQSRIETAIRTEKVADRPTSKESEVLSYLQSHTEVTSRDIAEHLHVSRQQAHKLISGLVQKGYVTKKGGTKSSYYTLK